MILKNTSLSDSLQRLFLSSWHSSRINNAHACNGSYGIHVLKKEIEKKHDGYTQTFYVFFFPCSKHRHTPIAFYACRAQKKKYSQQGSLLHVLEREVFVAHVSESQRCLKSICSFLACDVFGIKKEKWHKALCGTRFWVTMVLWKYMFTPSMGRFWHQKRKVT